MAGLEAQQSDSRDFRSDSWLWGRGSETYRGGVFSLMSHDWLAPNPMLFLLYI